MKSIHWLVLGIAVSTLTGCGGGVEVSDQTLAQIQYKVEEAKMLFGEKNYAAALPVLEEATKSSYVGQEQLVELLLMKARCKMYTGVADEALADIEYAEQGAEDLSVIHLAKYEYWSTKGDSGKAQESLQLAQVINPQIQLPQR